MLAAIAPAPAAVPDGLAPSVCSIVGGTILSLTQNERATWPARFFCPYLNF